MKMLKEEEKNRVNDETVLHIRPPRIETMTKKKKITVPESPGSQEIA